MIGLPSPAALLVFDLALIALVFSRRVTQRSTPILRGVASVLCILSLAVLLAVPATASTITEYRLQGSPMPWGIAVSGSDVWFIERGNNRIARLTGSSLRGWNIYTVGSQSWAIIIGPNGNPWFTESLGKKIVKLDFSANKMLEWTIPSADPTEPRGLVWNQTGNSEDFWFTDYTGNRIGHMHPTGVGMNVIFSLYEIPTAGAKPLSIAMSPLDHSVWWTEHGSHSIGSLKLLDNGTALFRHYDITPDSEPWGIGVDPAGYVWVTESKKNNIGRLNPVSGEYVTFAIPTSDSQPHELAVEVTTAVPASIVNIWFTEHNKDRIGKYVPGTNVFFEYPIITAGGRPHGIALASGSKPDVWFTEPFAEKIGRLIQTVGPTATTTVNTITSAFTTSTTLSPTRTQVTSSTKTSGTTSVAIGVVSSTVTSSMTTLTDTVSIIRDTITSIVSKTVTSTSRSSTTTTTGTTKTSTYVGVSTLSFSTTITSTSTSTIVETFTASTSATTTVVQVSTSPATSTATATSTSRSPTVTVTMTNTTFRNMTTFSPTVTISQILTSFTTTTSSTTTLKASSTTTVTTVAITRPCIIASAAHGSEMASEVQSLRGFRDGIVMQTFPGGQFMRAFERFYYSFSPNVAAFISSNDLAQRATRAAISPLIAILDLSRLVATSLGEHSDAAIVISGLISCMLIGIVYLLIPIMAVRAAAVRVAARRTTKTCPPRHM